jgi:hypothetical protein
VTGIEKQIHSPDPGFDAGVPEFRMAAVLKFRIRCIGGGVLSTIHSRVHEVSNSVEDNMECCDASDSIHLKTFIHFSAMLEE